MIQSGIEVKALHSKLMDQELELYIKLPWRYDRNDIAYPVLFTTDGNRSFPLYSTMSLIYETPGSGTQEIVIVGVGYKTDSDRIRGLVQWAAWRTRDLTPVRREAVEQYWNERLSALLGGEELSVKSGEASLFLRSLQEEIIPFVEENYRLTSTHRGLAGYSDGGLFTLYALFHAPDLFTQYFVGSPTMYDQLFEYEEHYAATHHDLKAKLFISVGGLESDLLEPIQRMADRLRSRGYPGLELVTQVFEGEGHSSGYAAAVSRALHVLYYENILDG